MGKDSTDHLRIAFLLCDEPAVETQRKHGGYDDLLHSLLEPILKENNKDLKLDVHGYDVVEKREYPELDHLNEIDAVIVSGSFVDDACEDKPWIFKLMGFLLFMHDSFPRIRIIGICFGHQVVSRAFSGSRIAPSDKGWEVGATELSLTALGEKVFKRHLDKPSEDRKTMVIQQIHSDEVKGVPSDFELLARSDKTEIQSLCKFYPNEEEGPHLVHSGERAPYPWSRIRILTMQGHPEWHSEVISPLVDEFEKDGRFKDEAKDFVAQAHHRAELPDDGPDFGVAILRVLGVYIA